MRSVIQIIFCSCVNETTLSPSCDHSCVKMADCFTDLSKSDLWSNNNKNNKLGYRKILWFISVSNITIFCSTLSNNCQLFTESGISQMLYSWSFSGLNCLYFPNILIEKNQSWLWTDFTKNERFSTTSKIPSKGILPHPPTTGSVNANGLLSFPLTV